MDTPIVVAQCGRDREMNVIDPGQHLAEAVYLENQPEGSGWFIPPWCPECEAEALRELEDPARRAEIDAYMASAEFARITNYVEWLAVYNKIMRQGEE